MDQADHGEAHPVFRFIYIKGFEKIVEQEDRDQYEDRYDDQGTSPVIKRIRLMQEIVQPA